MPQTNFPKARAATLRKRLPNFVEPTREHLGIEDWLLHQRSKLVTDPIHAMIRRAQEGKVPALQVSVVRESGVFGRMRERFCAFFRK